MPRLVMEIDSPVRRTSSIKLKHLALNSDAVMVMNTGHMDRSRGQAAIFKLSSPIGRQGRFRDRFSRLSPRTRDCATPEKRKC